MGRNHVKKGRAYKPYDDETMQEALLEISEGRLSQKEAARKFKIAVGTLNNRIHNKHSKSVGRPTVLSSKEEDELISLINVCGEWGFPLSTYDVRMFVKYYMESTDKQSDLFKDKVTPGVDWIEGFLKRNKAKIATRVAANINRTRAEVSPEMIREYFENLFEVTKDVPPSNIFNYDETNVSDDTGKGKKKFLFRRGTKYPSKVENYSKSNTSILCCGSADGTMLPPYIIYKAENVYTVWRKNCPQGEPFCAERCCANGTEIARSESGWIDAQSFTKWFLTVFLPHAKRLPGPKVLLGDNLPVHHTPDVVEACRRFDIAFAFFVPNSTHLSQPLDVTVFRPMKEAWRKTLGEFKANYPKIKGIPKSVFAELLTTCFKKMDTITIRETVFPNRIKHNLMKGFETCGIVPHDPDRVLQKLPRTVSSTSTSPADTSTSSNGSDRMEGEMISFLKSSI